MAILFFISNTWRTQSWTEIHRHTSPLCLDLCSAGLMPKLLVREINHVGVMLSQLPKLLWFSTGDPQMRYNARYSGRCHPFYGLLNNENYQTLSDLSVGPLLFSALKQQKRQRKTVPTDPFAQCHKSHQRGVIPVLSLFPEVFSSILCSSSEFWFAHITVLSWCYVIFESSIISQKTLVYSHCTMAGWSDEDATTFWDLRGMDTVMHYPVSQHVTIS